VEGSCEHGIEPSDSTKCWEVLFEFFVVSNHISAVLLSLHFVIGFIFYYDLI
jgi:hypothetical protein